MFGPVSGCLCLGDQCVSARVTLSSVWPVPNRATRSQPLGLGSHRVATFRGTGHEAGLRHYEVVFPWRFSQAGCYTVGIGVCGPCSALWDAGRSGLEGHVMATSMHRQRKNVNSADAELCCGTDRLPRKLCSGSRLPRWVPVPASTSATRKVTTPFLCREGLQPVAPVWYPTVQGQLDLHRNAFTASSHFVRGRLLRPLHDGLGRDLVWMQLDQVVRSAPALVRGLLGGWC